MKLFLKRSLSKSFVKAVDDVTKVGEPNDTILSTNVYIASN